MPIVYTGSPYRTTFGELEQKSVVLLDTSAPELITRVPTPCAGMHLVSERWLVHPEGSGGFEGLPEFHLSAEQIEGSEIRLRYEVAPDQREAARAVAAKWDALFRSQGAASVFVEEQVLTTARARAPEIAQATTLGEKLRAYWRARGTEPEPERADRLVDMAHSLETQP
jgi:hypothetical protein